MSLSASLTGQASNPTPSTVSGAPGRPLRRRHACTNCYQIKIKCDGEKAGCSRCLQLNLSCEYELSMVGRNSNKRNRRGAPKTPNVQSPAANVARMGSQLPTDGATSSSLGLTSPPRSTTLGMTLGGDFGNDFLDMPALAMNQKSPSTTSPLSWSDMHGFGLDPSFSNPQMTTDYAASSDMWVSFPELGDAPSVTQVGSSTAPSVAVGGSAVSPPLSTTTLPQGTDAQSQVADANNPAAAFSLQSLLDVVHMLEKQMARSSIGLEEAMQATKVCMNIVAIALESEEMRRCSSCPNLIFMGLQMCIDLYEKALAGLREHGLFVQQDVSTKQWQWLSNISDEMMVDPEQHQQLQHQPSSSPVPQHLLARFRYGNYVFDLKDQIALGNHIIRRDVRHCIQVGHAVADRWLGHVQGRSSSQSSLNFQKAWHLEIERRATALIESLPVD